MWIIRFTLNKITWAPECEFKAVHSCYCLLFYFTLCLKQEELEGSYHFVSNQETTAHELRLCSLFNLADYIHVRHVLPSTSFLCLFFSHFLCVHLCVINQVPRLYCFELRVVFVLFILHQFSDLLPASSVFAACQFGSRPKWLREGGQAAYFHI